MGDPVGIAAYARDHLNPDGTVLLVEPFALDDKPANMATNPMSALFYTVSSAICTPNSLSQEVGLGLVPKPAKPASTTSSNRLASADSAGRRRPR